MIDAKELREYEASWILDPPQEYYLAQVCATVANFSGHARHTLTPSDFIYDHKPPRSLFDQIAARAKR